MSNLNPQNAGLAPSNPIILPTPNMPVSQLESLKIKANQIIDSILSLQRTIEASGHPGLMPAWPDILSKYNVLLTQTLAFSNALDNPFPTSGTMNPSSSKVPPQNIYERIALHPSMGMPDVQLDSEVVPLLRNQQTTDVLKMENDTVRRLAERMNTRGSLGVLGISLPASVAGPYGIAKKPEYEDVILECAEIRDAHDRRVDRAVRAVSMLKDKFSWKQRVVVDVPEPEELGWDPRFAPNAEPTPRNVDVAVDYVSDDEEESNSDSDDEFKVEGALVNPDATSPAVDHEGDLFGSMPSAT